MTSNCEIRIVKTNDPCDFLSDENHDTIKVMTF